MEHVESTAVYFETRIRDFFRNKYSQRTEVPLLERVGNTEVSDETYGRELFCKTNNLKEQRFFLFEHVESTEVSGEICRKYLFSETSNQR